MADRSNRIVATVIAVIVLVTGALVAFLTRDKARRQDEERMDRVLENPYGAGKAQEARLIDGPLVPAFELEDLDGAVFGTRELTGKVWVVDFIFTQCAGICPRMTAMMKILHDRLVDRPEVQLVSISVDPDRDSRAALEEYAKDNGADIKRWHFLRGEAAAVNLLAFQGFKLGEKDNPLNHSGNFALIDATGRIRGYYNGANEERSLNIENLDQDIRQLLDQGGH